MNTTGSGVLDKICAQRRLRIEEEKKRVPQAELEQKAKSARRPQNFLSPFLEPGLHVIAEVKLASPSQGDIAVNLDPAAVAKDYLANGARALSVLTEPDFFKGHLDYLAQIRRENPDALLLMKDFFIDEYQMYQAAVAGADAALLVVAALGPDRTQELLFKALELGLTPLVEVHNEDEMRIALELGARLIGVNNRDLKSLQVSLEVSERLARLVTGQKVVIAESGIKTGADIKRLKACGYDGFLVGTGLMKSGAPGEALRRLLKEGAK